MTIPELLKEGPCTLDDLGDHPKPRYANFIVHKLRVARSWKRTKEEPRIRGRLTTVYFHPKDMDRAIRRFVEENLDVFMQIDFSQNNFLNSSFPTKTVRKMHAELDMIMAEDLDLITLEVAIKAGISAMEESISHEKRSRSPSWIKIKMLEKCEAKLKKCVG